MNEVQKSNTASCNVPLPELFRGVLSLNTSLAQLSGLSIVWVYPAKCLDSTLN